MSKQPLLTDTGIALLAARRAGVQRWPGDVLKLPSGDVVSVSRVAVESEIVITHDPAGRLTTEHRAAVAYLVIMPDGAAAEFDADALHAADLVQSHTDRRNGQS